MNRIEQALAALKEKNEKAFITYITAGLPNYDKTKEIIKAQEKAGTDIIELGIPFSDPVADGPVIQGLPMTLSWVVQILRRPLRVCRSFVRRR